MSVLPRYPIYVPSKGRHEWPLTIRFLLADAVPFVVVVEREEFDAYAAVCGAERLLVLPESGRGLIYARNWIMDHAIAAGAERHWQIDDNIGRVRRFYRGKRIPCNSGPALRSVEDFVDRYTNVGLAGLDYVEFARLGRTKVLTRNVHVYSCTLINNRIEQRWRLRYNDDTDLCLQVLAGGWCTVLVRAFLIDKRRTMTVPGGNTDDLYRGDGRLEMARSLERAWPGVVRVDRRWGRPQHVINWRKFDTPLELRSDVDLDALEPNDYGLRLSALRPAAAAPIVSAFDAEEVAGAL